jgi:dTDP-4-dehydrorhamnose 3,5-epimerase
MIDGVIVRPLERLPDERGYVSHMLRNDEPWFNGFGEIYFSAIYPGAIKAWHLHRVMELNYACIHGMIRLVLYDGREESPTHKEQMELFIGDLNYCLVKIPPMVWNGFKGVSQFTSIVANCATHPHSMEELVRSDPRSGFPVEYNWDRKDG